MSYHISGLAGHGHPPWGPEGGLWWRRDGEWTPNIQGPWYVPPAGDLLLTVPQVQPQGPTPEQVQAVTNAAAAVAQQVQAQAVPWWQKPVLGVPAWAAGVGLGLAILALRRAKYG